MAAADGLETEDITPRALAYPQNYQNGDAVTVALEGMLGAKAGRSSEQAQTRPATAAATNARGREEVRARGISEQPRTRRHPIHTQFAHASLCD